ncbi:putative tyrosine-protein phosphatase non-receptor type 14 [Trichinella spiralis]|uniref:putative tyrosine-protein phosphatase non-receptor type 14 n=1 Tax=Trichinella spiralis TaxID=6334 RepID=UPI0001EFC935|nr:putative tyrosine-protein phosphatase non-receptor type 14 [Trichinella spiralis]
MPFKLCSGKRAGRYDLSKNLYIVTVQLLDGSILQCTLSSDSPGKVCLDYVCYRLNLRQSVFFGLRYKSNRLVYRWVELDKPLRKQFDKSVQHLKLHFGVVFHTPCVNTLIDDVTRYYYYLQMRADILEGRLLVSPEKAILLASYSLQVEFGDYDENKHTVDVFRHWMLLPKHLTQSPQILEDLVRQVILGYKSLRGLPQAQAELLYTSEAQKCEGYGEEYFPGRVGHSMTFQAVLHYLTFNFVNFRMKTETTYSSAITVKMGRGEQHSLEQTKFCRQLRRVEQSVFSDETARYAATLFSLQSQFFRSCDLKEYAPLEPKRPQESVFDCDTRQLSHFRRVPMNLYVSGGWNREGTAAFPCRSDHTSLYHLDKLYDDDKLLPSSRKAHSSGNLACPTTIMISDNDRAASSRPIPARSTSKLALSSASSASLVGTEAVDVPAYRTAPNYETALSQPSLDEYNLALYKALQSEQSVKAAFTSQSMQSVVWAGLTPLLSGSRKSDVGFDRLLLMDSSTEKGLASSSSAHSSTSNVVFDLLITTTTTPTTTTSTTTTTTTAAAAATKSNKIDYTPLHHGI